MKKVAILLTISLSLIFCKAVLGELYGINKYLTFESREAAAIYLQKKHSLDKNKVFFFRSENARMNFFNAEDSQVADMPYYTLMLNDSIKVDDSKTGDRGCIGVVDKFVIGYDKSTATFIPKKTFAGLMLLIIKEKY